MDSHNFLFIAGHWKGSGEISLAESEEPLIFTTQWTIEVADSRISCTQEIEIEGLPEKMSNAYLITHQGLSHFDIQLSNPLFGTVVGKGLKAPNFIAWEFRGLHDAGFDGFEKYDRHPNGLYSIHAEYTSGDHSRTVISGSLWPA